jgi:hypothetical protein
MKLSPLSMTPPAQQRSGAEQLPKELLSQIEDAAVNISQNAENPKISPFGQQLDSLLFALKDSGKKYSLNTLKFLLNKIEKNENPSHKEDRFRILLLQQIKYLQEKQDSKASLPFERRGLN